MVLGWDWHCELHALTSYVVIEVMLQPCFVAIYIDSVVWEMVNRHLYCQ